MDLAGWFRPSRQEALWMSVVAAIFLAGMVARCQHEREGAVRQVAPEAPPGWKG